MAVTFAYTLGVVVEQVEEIEKAIQNMEQAMRHVSPAAVDVLRRNKSQLESLLERIMNANVTSYIGLQNLIAGNRKCLQDCYTDDYTDRQSHIERTRLP